MNKNNWQRKSGSLAVIQNQEISTKKEKDSVQNNALALLKGREMVFNAFRSGIVSMPSSDYTKNQKNQMITIKQ